MKKILFLLLSTVAMYGQVPADATPLENIQITNNTTDNSATKVNVQSTDGTINTISKSDLVNVVEVNDVPSLPLVGEVGKIYVVKNVSKIYRWNGTFYQELAGSDISGKINVSEKGAINGVATLGSDGKVPNSQIPALAISETFPVSSQAQMLALSQADQGDVAIRSDISKSFILRVSPSSVLGNWSELLTPTGAVTTVFGRNGAVTAQTGDYNTSQVAESIDKYYQTYNQKLYNDATSSIQTQLNAKQASGSYEIAFSKNTAFNKNFGTTAGTVVEGGTLGSNAYTSTAYLPLSGGTVNGSVLFNSTTGGAISFQTNSLPLALMTSSQNITGGAASATDFNTYVYGNNPYNIWTDGVKRVTVDGSGNVDFTGIVTAPTAPAGTNTTQIATTAFVQANSRPYKVYTALLTQSGTNAPVATVLENTLGGTVVWTRGSTGLYNGTLTGIFTASKTVFFINQGSGASRLSGHRPDTNTVQVVSMNAYLNELVDNSINNASIEIRVYN